MLWWHYRVCASQGQDWSLNRIENYTAEHMTSLPSVPGISEPTSSISTTFFTNYLHDEKSEFKQWLNRFPQQFTQTFPGLQSHGRVAESGRPTQSKGRTLPLTASAMWYHWSRSKILRGWNNSSKPGLSNLISIEGLLKPYFKVCLPPWPLDLSPGPSSASFIPTYLVGWKPSFFSSNPRAPSIPLKRWPGLDESLPVLLIRKRNMSFDWDFPISEPVLGQLRREDIVEY